MRTDSIASRIERAQKKKPNQSQLKMARIPEGAQLVDASDFWFPVVIVDTPAGIGEHALMALESQHFEGGELANDEVRSELSTMIDRLLQVIQRTRSTERLDLRGSILVVGSEASRADQAAHSIVEHGHRTLTALAAVDAERILGRRTVAGVVLDGLLGRDAQLAVTAAAGAAPVVEVEDPATAGRKIDDALRFEMGSG